MADTPLRVAQDELTKANNEITRATSDLSRVQSELAQAQADLASATHALAAIRDATGLGESADAGGPRVTSATLDRATKALAMLVDKPLAPATINAHGFAVSVLTANGWQAMTPATATLSADGLSVVIALRADPGTNRVRFLAFGTGTTPMLGTDGVPLAGGAGAPAGSADDGHDYVQMFT